jgi:nitrogen regulatory protein PII
MEQHRMKLVTIVCEALAREPLTKLLGEIGAQGYTLHTVQGVGEHGDRPGDIGEFANIRVEVLLQTAPAEALLERLRGEFFSRFASIAWETDVRVLRPEKF